MSGNSPAHAVVLSSFSVDKYEVTQKSYQLIMGALPQHITATGDDIAVNRVSWVQAALYCNARSKNEGLDTAYTYDPDLAVASFACDMESNGYRLPTEAEWEYVSRAGATTLYPWGEDEPVSPDSLDKYCIHSQNSGGTVHSVGTKEPNGWGIYGVQGNVAEWCNDWYESGYPAEEQTDPTGPSTGTERVFRGGCYNFPDMNFRSPYRSWGDASDAFVGLEHVGLRCVRRE